MRTALIIVVFLLWISVMLNIILILFTLPARDRTIKFLSEKIRDLFHKKFVDLNHEELIELYKKLDDDTPINSETMS